MFRVKKWREAEIQAFLARQAHSRFSYPEVGATATSPPRHYNIDRTRVQLGHGEDVWKRAVEAVRAWQMFNIPWLKLYWPDAPIRPETNVTLMVRQWGLWSLNACRIVYVVEDEKPDLCRYGFAYGTLIDHAAQGEERFTVEWNRKDDTVWYDILAFSRPKNFLAKMVYPLFRSLQHRFARASCAAMLAAVCPLSSRPVPNPMIPNFVSADATIAELAKKAAECEQKAAKAAEPLAAELWKEAKIYRDWITALRSGRWTS